jgi:hypothetical protein
MKAAFALVALLAIPAVAAEDPGRLIVVYQAAPANRAAFLRELTGSGARQLQRWKDEGALRDYRLLVSRYLDSRTWDAMAILTVKDAARWKKIERDYPAGVSADVLALTSSVETVPATLVRHGERQRDEGESVFLVIPYEVTVPTPEYVAYLDDYVLPQLAGWSEEGVLDGHGVYLAQFPAGRQWQSLLLLEYRSDEALAARESVVAKVRAKLAANAKWKAVSDNKKHVRNERAPVVADPVSWRPIK